MRRAAKMCQHAFLKSDTQRDVAGNGVLIYLGTVKMDFTFGKAKCKIDLHDTATGLD
jgi:hypothetical protein